MEEVVHWMVHHRCSRCKKHVCAQKKYYLKNLQKFKVTNVEELNQVYVCRECRGKDRRKQIFTRRATSFINLKPVVSARIILQSYVNNMINRGNTDPAAMAEFANKTKILLDGNMVHSYDFVVVDGVLKGLMLHRIPFIGDAFIPLNADPNSETKRRWAKD